MQRAAVVGRGDRDRRDPELAAGAEDPHGDLAAVRHQELPDRHRCGSYWAAIPWPARCGGCSSLLAFVLLGLPAAAGAGTVFVIDGRGWGHGVGMSQYGARGYAEDGWGYRRILAHYYRGTELRARPGAAGARPARRGRAYGADRLARSRSGSSTRAGRCGGSSRGRRTSPREARAAALPLRFVPGAAPLRSTATPTAARCSCTGAAASSRSSTTLPLDRYLRGVVPWEMPDDWHRGGAARAGRRRALVRARDAEAGHALRPLRGHAQPGLRRHPRRGGDDEPGDRLDRRPGRSSGTAASRRPSTTRPPAAGPSRSRRSWPKATPVPYLVSVADPHDATLEASPLGPVRLTPARRREEARRPGRARPRSSTRGPSGRVDGRAPEGWATACGRCESQDVPPRARPSLDLVHRPRAQPRPAAGARARGPAACKLQRVRPRPRQGPARAAGERRRRGRP